MELLSGAAVAAPVFEKKDGWQPVNTAPLDEGVELLTADGRGEPYPIPYPCKRTASGWVSEGKGTPVPVTPRVEAVLPPQEPMTCAAPRPSKIRAQVSGPSDHLVQFRNSICRHPKFRAKQVRRDFNVGLLLMGVVVPDKIEDGQRYNCLTVHGPFASTDSRCHVWSPL